MATLRWDLTTAAQAASYWPSREGEAVTAGLVRASRSAKVAGRQLTDRIAASAAARKLAHQLNVDLESVEGTGPGGLITSSDVERAANATAQAAAAPRRELVALPDGRHLAALIAGPANLNPALVFLHGLGGSLMSWTQVMPAFADRYRVAAIDLPGHGGSDMSDPATTDYSVPGLAAATGEAIASLGLAPAVLIGHSLGGAVALQIALDRPKLARAVILVDSAGIGPEINAELIDRIVAEPSRDEIQQLLELFFEDRRLVLDRGIDDLYRQWTKPGAHAALKAVAAGAFDRNGQKVNLGPRLAELNRPVHLIWGERDRVIPLHHSWSAATFVPYAWIDILEGVGHVPQIEAPQATVQAIDEFLRALPPPGITVNAPATQE